MSETGDKAPGATTGPPPPDNKPAAEFMLYEPPPDVHRITLRVVTLGLGGIIVLGIATLFPQAPREAASVSVGVFLLALVMATLSGCLGVLFPLFERLGTIRLDRAGKVLVSILVVLYAGVILFLPVSWILDPPDRAMQSERLDTTLVLFLLVLSMIVFVVGFTVSSYFVWRNAAADPPPSSDGRTIDRS